MVTHPNCKINLGLRILRKRSDGYHDLSTIFLPVPLCDQLEIEPLPQATDSPTELRDVQFTQSGIPVDCPAEENICVKAYRLLKRDYPQMLPVRMHLSKNIPFGAGLGGGSSDGAFALRMLNKIFCLGLNPEQLRGYATALGADCAFFIDNVPALATGIGQILTPLGFNPIENYQLVMAKPNDTVSTREAYGGLHITPAEVLEASTLEAVQMPATYWKDIIINDFERTVFPLHPKIAQLKEFFYAQGAIFASMSGSGATVFALFPPKDPLPASLLKSLGHDLLYPF